MGSLTLTVSGWICAQTAFVFTNRRSLIHVKASSIDRRLAKTALEARLGTFVAADYEQGSEKQEYQKRPRFARVDTSRLWEEYQAKRELHKTLRQAKLVSLATSRALQIDGVNPFSRIRGVRLVSGYKSHNVSLL